LAGIPLFSVSALIAVSAWITYDAVLIILDPSDSADVNVLFLFGFAAGNALIDVVCAALFFIRRKDVLKTPLHQTQRGDGGADCKGDSGVQESLLEVSVACFSADRHNSPWPVAKTSSSEPAPARRE
jgi:hypothetical protein